MHTCPPIRMWTLIPLTTGPETDQYDYRQTPLMWTRIQPRNPVQNGINAASAKRLLTKSRSGPLNG